MDYPNIYVNLHSLNNTTSLALELQGNLEHAGTHPFHEFHDACLFPLGGQGQGIPDVTACAFGKILEVFPCRFYP